MYCESESSPNDSGMEDWTKILMGPAEIIKGKLSINLKLECVWIFFELIKINGNIYFLQIGSTL